MLKFDFVQTKQVVEVTCDSCGSVCVKGLCAPIGEFAEFNAHWGYDSKHDGQKYNLHICENCFFDLIKNFKNKPFEELF